MCSVRSRLSFQLTAVSASDHLRAFSMCLDSGICMATLLPYASSRLLLMDCVCLCVRAHACPCVLGVLDGGIRDGSSKRIYHRLCTYMRAFTPYSVMEDFNSLVFHHTDFWDLVRDVQLHLALHGMFSHGGLVILNTPLPLPRQCCYSGTSYITIPRFVIHYFTCSLFRR